MANKTKLSKEEIKSNYSGKDQYDIIIIGSGITGLATGLMWLKNTLTMPKRKNITTMNPLNYEIQIMNDEVKRNFKL